MKILSQSFNIKKGLLDDDYTLFENGDILHEYDKSQYPGGINLKETLTVEQISNEVKKRLFQSASKEMKALVQEVLRYDIKQ